MTDTESNQIDYKFDYSIYNNNQKEIIGFLNEHKYLQKSQETDNQDKLEEAQNILERINIELGSNLELNQLDYALLNSENTENLRAFYVENGYLSIQEMDLMEKFGDDVSLMGFKKAISNLRDNVIALNPNEQDFEKYNLLVNTLLLANDYFTENNSYLKAERPSWWKAAGCAVAIASNAGATYGLIACAIPNPTTPAACGIAATLKVLSLAGVVLGC